MAGQSLPHPVNVVEACQLAGGWNLATALSKRTAVALSAKVKAGFPLENAPFMLVARGPTTKPVLTFADHALQFPGAVPMLWN
jgi:hypothetical protein